MASRSEQLVWVFPKQQIGAEGLPSALRWRARRAWATFPISGAATGGGLHSCRPRADLVKQLVSPKARLQPRPLPGWGIQEGGPAGSIVELARRAALAAPSLNSRDVLRYSGAGAALAGGISRTSPAGGVQSPSSPRSWGSASTRCRTGNK